MRRPIGLVPAIGLIALSSVLALSSFAADAKPDPHAKERAARAEFEKSNGAVFAGARLIPCDVAGDALRFDAPRATGRWTVVLPYSDDERVRFMDIELRDGEYVRGTIRTLGAVKPVPIDAKAFERLREEFPMIAVKRSAVVYPARKTGSRKSLKDAQDFGDNTVARVLGPLADSLNRLGLVSGSGVQDPTQFGYRVTLTGSDGLVTDLGVERLEKNRVGASGLASKGVILCLKDSIETAKPEERGRLSERRLFEYWSAGELSWAGVVPEVK